MLQRIMSEGKITASALKAPGHQKTYYNYVTKYKTNITITKMVINTIQRLQI